jgi:hypothetical protein
MPDRSPSTQTREGQHDIPLPIGIPLAAVIAVLFTFWFHPLQFGTEKLRCGSAAKHGVTGASLERFLVGRRLRPAPLLSAQASPADATSRAAGAIGVVLTLGGDAPFWPHP